MYNYCLYTANVIKIDIRNHKFFSLPLQHQTLKCITIYDYKCLR